MNRKSFYLLFFSLFIPNLSFAAGSGYEGLPLWVGFLLLLIIYIPFPATFIFLGYLVTKVNREKRKSIIKIYAPGVISFVVYLTLLVFSMFHSRGVAETRWAGLTILFLLFLTFVHSIYFSYKINQFTDRKYAKRIKYFWWTVAASVIAPMMLPLAVFLITNFVASIPNVPPQSVESKVLKYIQTQCPEIKKCRIVLSDFTDFDWDMFYYVSTAALLDTPPANHLFKVPKDHGFGNAAFVFLNNYQTVWFEKLPYEVEHIPNDAVLISYPSDQFVRKEDAVFVVEKKKDFGVYYELHTDGATSSVK